jgi:hypothetical protein
MVWQQVYDPFHSMALSTLAAAIPVAVMLIGLGFLHLKAHLAAGAGLLAALAIAIFAYGMPADEVVDHALAWLDTASRSRFFGWLHFYDAHTRGDLARFAVKEFCEARSKGTAGLCRTKSRTVKASAQTKRTCRLQVEQLEDRVCLSGGIVDAAVTFQVSSDWHTGFTASMAGVSTFLVLPLGLGLAWCLALPRWKGKAVLETIVTLPLVLPPVVTGLFLLQMLGRRGPVGRWLHEMFGLDIIFTWRAVVIALTVMSLPLLVRSARSAFEGVDRAYEQIARTLGAGVAGARRAGRAPRAQAGRAFRRRTPALRGRARAGHAAGLRARR